MHDTWVNAEPLDVEDFADILKALLVKPKKEIKKEYDKLIAAPVLTKKQKQKINKKYQFKKEEKALIKTLELSSEIKAKITDAMFVVSSIAQAVRELSARWQIDRRLIYKMKPEEIILATKLFQIPPKLLKSIQKRDKIAIWVKDEKIKIFYQDKAEIFLERKIAKEEIGGKEISGTPIFQGNIKGTARVVRALADFSKVKQGDILVCGDFSPDFVILANKISAIVTNEGGVMSHAAIVAREMKIPCVTGTKIATKVIRSGDILELDGKRGIVKII